MSPSQNQGCLTAILKLFGVKFAPEIIPEIPYRQRDDFLSSAEFSFYKVLQQAVGTEMAICPKVGLNDLFYVPRSVENSLAHLNKINRKHVDFVLCDVQTMRPLLAIELDDSSHKRKDRQDRDDLVDSVFKAAQLPLLHVTVKRAYQPADISKEINAIISHPSDLQPAPDLKAGSPICSKCDAPMILRTASRGQNKGQQFWGCVNYPQCKEIVQFNN